MKNKTIINEQSNRAVLERFFTMPNCFDESTASIVEVVINGKQQYAIEKVSSSDSTKYGYFTADGKIYQTNAEGNLVDTGEKWSCNTGAKVSPTVKYFNNLNIDLTVPDQIEKLNSVIRQVNRFLREGAKGESLRSFVYFVNALKKDPDYSDLQITNVDTTGASAMTNSYSATTGGDVWDWTTNPDPDEMENFTEVSYTINNVPFKFYKWKGASRAADKVDVGYDPKKCYEGLINYVQMIGGASTTPTESSLRNYKSYVEKCYGRFWNNGQLMDKDVNSQKIKLNLPFGVSKNEVQGILTKLLNRQDNKRIDFTIGLQESLNKRLKKALLESIEHKKKAVVESKIIKGRISALINENLDYTKKENQITLMEEVSEEINELKSNGYNMKLVNENFFQWLSSFLGTEQGDSKEYITNWFIKLFDIEPTSRLSESLSKALENVPESEYGQLFSDCDYTSDLLAKALVEAMMQDMAENPDSTEVVSGMFKDSIIDTLNQDKISISNRMKEKIHNFVCEKLNKVHINMENTKNEIIDKALS